MHVFSLRLEEALARNKAALPAEFGPGTWCDEYEARCDACARTWLRPHAMDNLLDIVPLGQLKSSFNFSTADKRVLNMENEVDDSDNIKQDLSSEGLPACQPACLLGGWNGRPGEPGRQAARRPHTATFAACRPDALPPPPPLFLAPQSTCTGARPRKRRRRSWRRTRRCPLLRPRAARRRRPTTWMPCSACERTSRGPPPPAAMPGAQTYASLPNWQGRPTPPASRVLQCIDSTKSANQPASRHF